MRIPVYSEPVGVHKPRDDSEAVYCWRLKHALELGYLVGQAEELAASRRDLHDLEDEIDRLLEQGCSRDLALAIAA